MNGLRGDVKEPVRLTTKYWKRDLRESLRDEKVEEVRTCRSEDEDRAIKIRVKPIGRTAR